LEIPFHDHGLPEPLAWIG